jgi:sortase A
MVTGMVACSWVALVTARADYMVWRYAEILPARAVESPRLGTPIGLLTVSRLDLTSVVVEGDTSQSLVAAAGHLPDTPFPWQPGNSAIAGHRDTDFRSLRDIHPGDVVRFLTASDMLEYVVRDTRIVEPSDVGVIHPTDRPTLTLITCYPFHFIGPAPMRFVVRAELMSPASARERPLASNAERSVQTPTNAGAHGRAAVTRQADEG